jgi:hypothetical protein
MWRGGHALPRQGQECPRDTLKPRRVQECCFRSLVHPPDPSTLTRNGVVGLRQTRAIERVNRSADTSRVRRVRALVVVICGLGYWAWATVALGTAVLARAASEEPPFSEERIVLWLAFFSWLLANTVLGLRRGGLALLGIWALQAGLVLVALVSTLDLGGVRVAPPIIAIGVMGQLAGLVVVAVRLRGVEGADRR